MNIASMILLLLGIIAFVAVLLDNPPENRVQR